MAKLGSHVEFNYSFRWAKPSDFDALGRVMYDAVHTEPSPYNEFQRRAWVPEPRRGMQWANRLKGQQIIIAEADGAITGFMSLAPGNYIDFAYIRPSGRGTGLFRELYQRIENRAFASGAKRLRTHASLSARPAFDSVGFKVVTPEDVEISGFSFQRFEMVKSLNS